MNLCGIQTNVSPAKSMYCREALLPAEHADDDDDDDYDDNDNDNGQ